MNLSMIITPLIIFAVLIVGMIVLGQWSNRRKVRDRHLCLIVTKSRGLVVGLYPKSGGNIKAPPNKLFLQDSNDKEAKRVYGYDRKFSLNCTYPLMPSGFSKLTAVDAFASIYEEGDYAPILPSDVEPIQTPERVGSMVGQDVVSQVMGSLSSQFGGGGGMGLNLGKNKTLVMIMLGAIVLCIMISAWAGFQGIQFMDYAKQWMALR